MDTTYIFYNESRVKSTRGLHSGGGGQSPRGILEPAFVQVWPPAGASTPTRGSILRLITSLFLIRLYQ
jgi:hypothetical protein